MSFPQLQTHSIVNSEDCQAETEAGMAVRIMRIMRIMRYEIEKGLRAV